MASQKISFDAYAARLRPRVEQALDRSLADIPDGCPSQLREAMRYSLLAPGKRVRPLLVLMACEACGGEIEQAMPAACAVEMVHVFSLIHDDLPCMDDDHLRRGKATNHIVFGEGEAMLAGDALFALAFEILSRDLPSPEIAEQCCNVLAKAVGPSGMAGGQSDDLRGVTGGASIDYLEALHKRKTGALLEASLRMGGIVAGAEESMLKALAQYGWRLGLAFQIIDDLLDVEGEKALAGKDVGKDLARGKLTFPGLLGIPKSKSNAEKLIREAQKHLDVFGQQADPLHALAEYVVERKV